MTIQNLDIDHVKNTLQENDAVVFAYLYGSAVTGHEIVKDIDIAVFLTEVSDPHSVSADLKIALSKAIGISPDAFDVRAINDLPIKGDIYSLIYLNRVFEEGIILADKNPETRSAFLESYAVRYRECEGLIQEVLA